MDLNFVDFESHTHTHTKIKSEYEEMVLFAWIERHIILIVFLKSEVGRLNLGQVFPTYKMNFAANEIYILDTLPMFNRYGGGVVFSRFVKYILLSPALTWQLYK